MKIAHLLYVPFVGLGLYGGMRGKRWLRNRITIFKQFVIPSLLNQTNQNFILWVSWRYEERTNPQVKELKNWLDTKLNVVFTYAGVCFWDDKYPDEIAYERLINAIHGSMGELVNVIGEADYVLMTIQPSDDCYHRNMVAKVQEIFNDTSFEVVGFEKGYIMNYLTKELAEYNPNTFPPFFTIKFPRATFIDPLKHVEYASYKSHEYVMDKLNGSILRDRGFIVGTHGENISTHFNHPFKGLMVSRDILKDFGLFDVEPLKIKFSFRKKILRMLPHNIQRKLRYWLGEKFFARLYEFLRM